MITLTLQFSAAHLYWSPSAHRCTDGHHHRHVSRVALKVWVNISAAFSAVRFDATWERIEASRRGVYNFTLYDAMVARCLASGVVPYIILDYDNPLYGTCPPGHCLCTRAAVDGFLTYVHGTLRHRCASSSTPSMPSTIVSRMPPCVRTLKPNKLYADGVALVAVHAH